MKKLILTMLLTGSYLMANEYINDNQIYEGSSGSKYQYDLSDLGDKLDYSLDLDAQRRDDMSLDLGRNLDRGIGQYGGGIYDD
jgi:hypothetical protein